MKVRTRFPPVLLIPVAGCPAVVRITRSGGCWTEALMRRASPTITVDSW